MNILYEIFISPIEAILRLVLSASYSVIGSYGASIFLLSLLINLALLPLFHIAEKWQEAERRIQRQLRPKLQEFRQAFSGEERHVMIHTLYRQAGYHPIYAMRSSLGLFLQLPFWIAAYHLLSQYQPLEGASFLLFEDLGNSDKLLWGINLLPFVMTVINLLAAFFYTRKLSVIEKTQPLVLALLFLVLLYNSPTGLLLYWTFNSIFSLARIALLTPTQTMKFERGEPSTSPLRKTSASSPPVLLSHAGGEGSGATESGRTILARLDECREKLTRFIKLPTSFNLALFLLVVVFQLLVHGDFLDKNGLGSVAASGVSIAILAYLSLGPFLRSVRGTERSLRHKLNVMLVGLLVAAFVVINVAWLSESYFVPHPARNIGGILLALLFLMFASPICDEIRILRTMPHDHWLFATSTCLTAFTLFVATPVDLYTSSRDFIGDIWGIYGITSTLLVYFFALILALTTLYVLVDGAARKGLTLLSVFSSLSMIVYSMMGVKGVGLMDEFILNIPGGLIRTKFQIVGEIAVLIVLFGAAVYATLYFRESLTYAVGATLVTTVCLTATDIYGATDPVAVSDAPPLDHTDIVGFSREENVLIIMLDGFPGGYIQKIKNEAPDTLREYEGFVWYPNMLTTNAGTWGSIATLAGGHKYTVQEINYRNGKSLRSSIIEAYGVYADAFIQKGYQVTYVNPSETGGCEGIDKRVHCADTAPYGIYYHEKEDADAPVLHDAEANLPVRLMMLSLFKASPKLFKSWIYNDGAFRGAHSIMLRRKTANTFKARHWGFLRVLAHESNTDSTSKTFKFIQIVIPHTPHALNNDCRLEPSRATVYTESVCALKEVGALLAWMKDKGIYDVTKIVLVSDHGWWVENPMFPSDFVKTVPEGYQYRAAVGLLQSLLLVKDFGAKGSLSRSDMFVSTPDVPSLVCSTIVTCRDVPPDPTKNNVGERTLTFNITEPVLRGEKFNKFDIIETYEVTSNIFDARNWKRVK